MTKYHLYHDESYEGGYWHGMLLVPSNKKHDLVSLLNIVRNNTRYKSPLGIKRVKRRGKVYRASFAWIQIGVGYLRSDSKLKKYPVYLGQVDKGNYTYSWLDNYCTGAKFILFREVESHNDLDGYPDYSSKVETTLRIGLKGGLHFLGNDEDPIIIESMHFDGYEHHKRHINTDRVIGRLNDLRSYCDVSLEKINIDDRSSNHQKAQCQDYDDCQLLQLTDLLLGSFRTSFGIIGRGIHIDLSRSVKVIIDKYRKGYARMKNSRWFNSFCMSQCYIYDDHWKFETISYERSPKTTIDMF